jgi:hypothetical protein
VELDKRVEFGRQEEELVNGNFLLDLMKFDRVLVENLPSISNGT